jgi:histidinol-phosphatase (PHP family)
MKLAAKADLPIITSSDAHKPEDCGSYIDEAIDYVKRYGYTQGVTFDKRKRTLVDLG